jgi:hypothetical protein
MAKNLYFSALQKMSPVTAVVTSDILDSKFKKAGMPNKFVGLKIEGEEYSHTLETEACVQALTGLKGKTVQITTNGNKDTSAFEVVILGQPASSIQKPAAQPHAEDAQSHQSAAPATTSAAPKHAPVFGATVGNCMKMAVDTVTAIGTDPFSPEFYRQTHQIASDLIRVAQMLEAGNLAASAKKQQQ